MWGGGGARVCEFFFTQNPNLKKKFWVGVGGGGGGRWMDRRTGPNQLAPSTSSKLGHNNALMYKLCP